MALKGEPFKKIGGFLKQVAPTLLTAAAGPGAPLAITIAKRVMGSAGMDDTALEDALVAATGNSEGVAKLREIESALKQAEMENGFKFAELEVKDRADARSMAKSTSLLPQIVLSALFVSGYFVIMGLFFAEHASVPMSEAFIIMLGVLTGGVPQVMNFWLGSSSGSAKKTDIMAGAKG